MTELLLAAVLAGLAAGAVHASTGPDHLAVVAPLAARNPEAAWDVGLRWGLGHALGVGLVGIAALLFREVLPMEALASWSERLVGGSLVLVGIWVGVALFRGGRRGAGPDRHDGGAALLVGTLHGTGGGTHLVGILPALAFTSHLAAAAYVLAFATGTVGAMTAFSWLVGSGQRRLGRLGDRARTGFVGGCAVASILVGLVWLAP